MRALNDAKASWQDLKAFKDLNALRRAVRLDERASVATKGGRSACWKAFLLFDNIDTASWPSQLASSRSAYDSLRTHFLRHLENPDELAATHDPLNDEGDVCLGSHVCHCPVQNVFFELIIRKSSPWTIMQRDEELRAEIVQDVERCMPENLYFRQPETQKILLDILFVFCKLNPDVSYRQGMHELLAPVLWVVERDAIDPGQGSKILGEDATIKAVFDAGFIEHDTFALFAQIMQSAKSFYEQTTHSGQDNPMVARSRRIFENYLSQVDGELAKHLQSVDVVPQIFLMRWIRLLFGREFAFDDMLAMWDVLLAEDPSFELVDNVCLAMILRIRWELITADLNEALSLLLRYPEVERDFVPQTLVLDALYLREHMDHSGGGNLVYRYTGRLLPQSDRPRTPPAIQRNITTFSGRSSRPTSSGSPTRAARKPRNIEAVLQNTAKNLYARGERLGIGKAVRNAVDEVQKRAQEIRDSQTPSPSNRPQRSRRMSSGSMRFQERINRLEERSRQLGKLLEGAVGELWEFQKTAADVKGGSMQSLGEIDIEKLSVAIAKVQFVQVYLDDPVLPLPEEESLSRQSTDENALLPEETEAEPSTNHAVNAKTQQDQPSPSPPAPMFVVDQGTESSGTQISLPESVPSQAQNDSKTDTPKTIPDLKEDATLKANNNTETNESASNISNEKDAAPVSTLRTRPRLENSSLSWMLGQEESSAIPSPAPFTEKRHARKILFGDSERDDSLTGIRRGASRTNAFSNNGVETIEADFDLSSLQHSKAK